MADPIVKRNYEWPLATEWDAAAFLTQDKSGGVTQRVSPALVETKLEADGFPKIPAPSANEVAVYGVGGWSTIKLTNTHIDASAAIGWGKISKAGAVAGDVGAEPALGTPGTGTYELKAINNVRAWTAPKTDNGIESTGLYSWSSPCLAIASGTTFNVSALSGQIVDSTTTPGAPVLTPVAYAGGTNITDPYVTTAIATYLSIDSSGALQMQPSHPTPEQRRASIYIGFLAHPTLTAIVTVTPEPDICTSAISQLRDLWDAIKFVNLGIRPYANGTNLALNVSGGTLFAPGINWASNPSSPMEKALGPYIAATFQYRLQTGAALGNTTAIDPGFYDLAGVRTAVGGGAGSATNQRVYIAPNGAIRIQYGQTVYGSLATAIASASTEAFVVASAIAENLQFIGIISVVKTATALNNTAQATFLPASKFGEISSGSAGSTTATLQTIYDNSLVPQILTNATIGALTVKRGSAADTDDVLAVQNGAGTKTASITGAGVISAPGGMVSGIGGAIPTPLSGSVGLSMAAPGYAESVIKTPSSVDAASQIFITGSGANSAWAVGKRDNGGSGMPVGAFGIWDSTAPRFWMTASLASFRVALDASSLTSRELAGTGTRPVAVDSTGKLVVSGGENSFAVKSSSFTLSASTERVIRTQGAITVTLPSASSLQGYSYTFLQEQVGGGALTFFPPEPWFSSVSAAAWVEHAGSWGFSIAWRRADLTSDGLNWLATFQ